MRIESKFGFALPRLPGAGRVVSSMMGMLKGIKVETTIDGVALSEGATLVSVRLVDGFIVAVVDVPEDELSISPLP